MLEEVISGTSVLAPLISHSLVKLSVHFFPFFHQDASGSDLPKTTCLISFPFLFFSSMSHRNQRH